jgi:ABC-type amino acid transport substrate-binding protein
MRVGINHGNLVLAQKNPTTGEVKGVAVDLAHELGRRLGVPVELVQYGSAGQMTDALTTGAWDVAFLAREAGRAGEIGFTAPHLLIEALPDRPGAPTRVRCRAWRAHPVSEAPTITSTATSSTPLVHANASAPGSASSGGKPG